MSAITILLPVRNGAGQIGEAVASIIAQDDPDWRLVVLDNHSDDGTVAIVRSFDDPRIELVRSDRPLDIHASWHRGVDWLRRNAAPETIASFIGHDDLLRPGFVRIIRALAARHSDATLYQTHFDLIDAGGAIIAPCRPVPQRETADDLAAALCWGIRDSYGTGYAFRVADYVAVGGIPDLPRLLYADHLLFIRLTERGYKAADPATGCAYRLHRGSASNGLDRARLNDSVAALAAFLSRLDAEPAGFAATMRGKAAIATLVARELELIEAGIGYRLLDAASRALVDGLRRQLADLRLEQPVAPPGVAGRLAALARRTNRNIAVLRTLLRRR